MSRRISDMTFETLREFVIEVVNDQLNRRQHAQKDGQSWEEALAAMDRIRWTPPPGSPTTLQLLREDRDR
ncbi:hypothetical protein [Scytonema sp. NUACC26]|uniref:hypothetical protein n=1 Tax=Scytonema sp. NUACC26 TaxID=3140176 RepID=UPI0034DBB5C0